MSFAAPALLLTLLLVPLALVAYALVQRRRSRYVVRFTNVDLLANLVPRSPGWRRHVPAALALLALTALLLALARPERAVAVPRPETTAILAFDVSGSMEAEDVEPTRLAAAQDAAKRFLDVLPDETRVGVVTFSTRASVAAAPTTDRAALAGVIDTLSAGGGTAIGDAVDASLRTGLADASRSDARTGRGDGAPAAVLLLSDGANTVGSDPLEAASTAASERIPVFTVALGTQSGVVEVPGPTGVPEVVPVPPDHETLAAIAERTGAEFFDAPDEDDLRRVYEQLAERIGYVEETRELTPWFTGAGALLLLAGTSLSALWFGRIP